MVTLAAFVKSLRRMRGMGASQTPLPKAVADQVRQVDLDADLTGLFSQSARAVGSNVHITEIADWIDVIRQILGGHDVHSVYVEPGPNPVFSTERVRALTESLSAQDVDIRTQADDATLFGVDASITGVSGAIAETGTIVCDSGKCVARGASLIPPIHIAVVGVSQIVPDLCDYFESPGVVTAVPANINLITGPSKTADIEGTLVTGVHGPGHVHVVIVPLL